jgi:hypothetical protein
VDECARRQGLRQLRHREQAESSVRAGRRSTPFDMSRRSGKWCPWNPHRRDPSDVNYDTDALNTPLRGTRRGWRRDHICRRHTTDRISKAQPAKKRKPPSSEMTAVQVSSRISQWTTRRLYNGFKRPWHKPPRVSNDERRMPHDRSEGSSEPQSIHCGHVAADACTLIRGFSRLRVGCEHAIFVDVCELPP